jgi:hypothetical protein
MFGRGDDNQQPQDDAQVQDTGAPAFTPPADITPTAAATNDDNITLPDSTGLPGNLTAPEPSTDTSAAPAPATTAPPQTSAAPASADDLVNIKQQALQHLSPLVDHLDQTPEERFRTTMMMIQATDDSSKIKDAYEAAQLITDEKVRAQALLDVVNEINYFTQQQNNQQK